MADSDCSGSSDTVGSAVLDWLLAVVVSSCVLARSLGGGWLSSDCADCSVASVGFDCGAVSASEDSDDAPLSCEDMLACEEALDSGGVGVAPVCADVLDSGGVEGTLLREDMFNSGGVADCALDEVDDMLDSGGAVDAAALDEVDAAWLERLSSFCCGYTGCGIDDDLGGVGSI
jgi:hypothetical protein